MFPLKKLRELSPRTRARKIALILQSMEMDMRQGRGLDSGYLRGLLELLVKVAAPRAGTPGNSDETPAVPWSGLDADIGLYAAPRAASEAEGRLNLTPSLGRSARLLGDAIAAGADADAILRGVNVLRNDVLASVGAEPSEWDLLSSQTGDLDRSTVRTLPLKAFLEDIRSPFNVGSLLRTAEAFGIERIYLSPRTPLPTHPRARKTARGAESALPWEVLKLSALRGKSGIFALELGGTPIQEFAFPAEGIVLVGSEELGLSPEALELADAGLGRVSIPLAGAKRSLNVAVAFGILMSNWRFAAERIPSPDSPT